MPPLRWGLQVADSLVLITPGQQFPAEFFIHAAISPDLALQKKLTGGKIIKLALNAPSAAREDV